ncbi:uncharacterized protein LOC111347036 [Stylophora pistillata]|uniref:uncharacterized protein LOC111347036 n=1 Tax=Stylophora pistillata TaxID=50429 RepID=UPI000C04D5FD|nr:uncharacterized protein LOC111347036 [Stylophora pistillata]
MASNKVSCCLFVSSFALGSAKYCSDSSDCSVLESCCTDYVCREKCPHCSSDSQCGTSEQCCNNECISSWSSCFCSFNSECNSGEQCCNSECISSSYSCFCSSDYECDSGEQCCNGICIDSWSTCFCSNDFECDSGEKCCYGKCISSSSPCSCSFDFQCDTGKECYGGVCSSYCGLRGVSIADVIIKAVIFFAIIIIGIYLFVIRREVRMQPIKPQKKQLEKPITNQSQIHESPELPKRLLQTPTTIGSTEPLPKPQKIITTSQSRKHASPEPPKRPLQKPTTNQLQTLGSKESPKRPVQKPTTSQGQTRGSTEPAIKPRKTITAGQSQSHESKTSGWPITRDEFLMWFWDSTNGNQLILDLNKFANSKRWDDRIRQEKYRPFIYAIVLNDGSFPFQAKDENVEDGTEKQWKLCKVGFTKKSVERGINNRMEQLSDKIKKTYQPKNYKEAMPYTLFAVPFRAIDTNPYHDTKKRIREKIGKRVKKEKPRN